MLQPDPARRLGVTALRMHAIRLESNPVLHVFRLDTCRTELVHGVTQRASMEEIGLYFAQRCVYNSAGTDFLLLCDDPNRGPALHQTIDHAGQSRKVCVGPKELCSSGMGSEQSPLFWIPISDRDNNTLQDAVEMDFSIVVPPQPRLGIESAALKHRAIQLLVDVFRSGVSRIEQAITAIESDRLKVSVVTAQGLMLYSRVKDATGLVDEVSEPAADVVRMAEDADKVAGDAVRGIPLKELQNIAESLDDQFTPLASTAHPRFDVALEERLLATLTPALKLVGHTLYGPSGLRDARDLLTRQIAVCDRKFTALLESAVREYGLQQKEQIRTEFALRERNIAERSEAVIARERAAEDFQKQLEAKAALLSEADARSANEATLRQSQLADERCKMENIHNQHVQRIAELTIEEQRLTEAVRIAAEMKRNAAIEHASLEEKALDFQRTLKQTEANVHQVQGDHAHALAQLNSVRTKAAEFQERQVLLETNVAQLERRHASLSSDCESADQALNAARDMLAVVQQETGSVFQLRDGLDQCRTKQQDLEEALAKALSDVSIANDVVKDKELIIRTLRARLTNMVGRVEAEKESKEQLANRVNDLEHALQESALTQGALEVTSRDVQRASVAQIEDTARVIATGRAQGGDHVLIYWRAHDNVWIVANNANEVTLDKDYHDPDELLPVNFDKRGPAMVCRLAKVLLQNANGTIIVEMPLQTDAIVLK